MSAMARPLSECNGEKSGTEWFMEKAEGADGASAEENEREGTDELGGELLGVEYMEDAPGRPGRILAEEGEEKQRS